MMRLNNKGITVVELVVSFALLSVLMFGLFNIITGLRKDATNEMFLSNITSFKNNLTVTIENDLIKNKIISVDNCSNNDLVCYRFNFDDGSFKDLIIDDASKVIRYDGIIYNTNFAEKIEFGTCEVSFTDNILKVNIPIYKIYDTTNYGIDITVIVNI